MVNLAGRGIAAEADFALWILEGDKNESSGREYFAHAGDSVVHEDFLSEAWEAFRSGAMAPDRFEHDLTFIVSEMEKSIWSRSQVAADD